MGNDFPHNIIIFLLGYKIEEKIHNFYVFFVFFSMKFTCNRCVWSTVIIFTFIWNCFCFLLRLMGNAGSP